MVTQEFTVDTTGEESGVGLSGRGSVLKGVPFNDTRRERKGVEYTSPSGRPKKRTDREFTQGTEGR